MIKRTFLKKCNTIVKGSEDNYGLNPIAMLHYGGLISRFLIYFDIEEIKKFYEDNISQEENKVKHLLKMTNCGSIDERTFNETIPSFSGSNERKRATSFDVIAFEVPDFWDEGIGFDSSLDYWLIGDSSVNKNGSTWYKAYNGKDWVNEGIYDSSFLSSEYDKFANGEDSKVISRQHFDYGNENLCIDITKYVEDVILNNKKNNGICICFSPLNENLPSEFTHYVGFFNNHTNTFFQPYIETVYSQQIIDNRFDFYIGRENKILFFANINDEFCNLDEIPICTINGVEYPVKHVKKGVYEASVVMNDVEPEVILYDVWSNIKFNGKTFDDVEMEFVTHSSQDYFSFGKRKKKGNSFIPHIQGINDMEVLNRGEIREIEVYFKEKYTHSDYYILDKSYYRIYIKSGDKEIDVINYELIDKTGDFNSFIIDTNNLLPQKYFVDIKACKGSETKVFKNCLEFKIVDNSTNVKR